MVISALIALMTAKEDWIRRQGGISGTKVRNGTSVLGKPKEEEEEEGGEKMEKAKKEMEKTEKGEEVDEKNQRKKENGEGMKEE